MNIKIVFHGSLKKYNNNRSEIEIDLPEGITGGGLVARTGIPKEEIAFVAVNSSRIAFDTEIHDGDEVKLFQMVGGG